MHMPETLLLKAKCLLNRKNCPQECIAFPMEAV